MTSTTLSATVVLGCATVSMLVQAGTAQCADGDTSFVAAVQDEGTRSFDFSKLACQDAATKDIYFIDAPEDVSVMPASVAALDSSWVLVCGALVFFMQAGFAMLESGAVRDTNTVNILFKNMMDCCVAAISFWLLGYGFAYGGDGDDGAFIGDANFGLTAEDGTAYNTWFFQFAFAATAATIVSGSVAERTSINAYLVFSTIITVFIYPVVVHWVWDAEGWLSAFNSEPIFAGNGMVDFAGSGVVHIVGGFAGLVGAIVVGPRKDRFERNEDGSAGAPRDLKGHSNLLVALGTLFLWFGWYGFNGGSTLTLAANINDAGVTAANVAGLVFTTTTIAAASACLAGTAIAKLTKGVYDLNQGMNSILAGLVSITASCAVVEPWHAMIVGVVGAFIYHGTSKLLVRLKIDDPLDAAPVHGFCGAWGVLCAGIFPTRATMLFGYGVDSDATETGVQFATQLVGVLSIIAWTVATSFLLFKAIDRTIGMRVTDAIEETGLDTAEHGTSAYNPVKPTATTAAIDIERTVSEAIRDAVAAAHRRGYADGSRDSASDLSGTSADGSPAPAEVAGLGEAGVSVDVADEGSGVGPQVVLGATAAAAAQG